MEKHKTNKKQKGGKEEKEVRDNDKIRRGEGGNITTSTFWFVFLI